jgi:hypothetical protein
MVSFGSLVSADEGSETVSFLSPCCAVIAFLAANSRNFEANSLVFEGGVAPFVAPCCSSDAIAAMTPLLCVLFDAKSGDDTTLFIFSNAAATAKTEDFLLLPIVDWFAWSSRKWYDEEIAAAGGASGTVSAGNSLSKDSSVRVRGGGGFFDGVTGRTLVVLVCDTGVAGSIISEEATDFGSIDFDV